MTSISAIKNKVLSDEIIDTRENLFDLENIKKEDVDLGFSSLVEQARSVACLMHKDNLFQNSDNTWELKLKEMSTLSEFLRFTLDKENPMPLINLFTSKLRFAKEPTFGFATGFLVQKSKKKAENQGTKYLVTAAHAICNKKTREIDPERIKATRIVFDYCMTGKNEFNKKFDAIYEIDKVVKFKYEKHELGAAIGDWALIKLKTVVEGRSPLKIEENPAAIKCNMPIYTLSYPTGTPQKYTHSGKTQFVGANIVKHTLLSLSASSGAPVFNAAGKVIGIIIQGPSNYSIDRRTNEINISAFDRDTAPFFYAPWFQKIAPLCEILNAPPKVVAKPSLPLKSLEKPIIPQKKSPSTWEEIKNIGWNIIHAPIAVAEDFLEEPSIEKGFKWGATWGGASFSAGIMGAAIPATVAGGPLILFGAAVVGLAGTAVTAVGVGATHVVIRKGIT